MATKTQKATKSLSPSRWSRAKKTWVTIIVFALIGGGWFVYKSFASNIIALLSADNFVASAQPGYATPTKGAASNGKSTFPIWVVPNRSIIYSSTRVTIPASATYQYCFNMKGVGNFYGSSAAPIVVLDANNFKTYCNQPQKNGPTAITVTPNVTNLGGTTLTFQSASVGLVTASSPASPAK